MASVYSRRGILYLTWWDNFDKKHKSRTFGLNESSVNREITKQFAKKFQTELDNKKKQLRSGLLINEPTIEEAYKHFKKNNSNKNIKTILDYDRFYKKFIEFFPCNSLCSEITKLKVEDWLAEVNKLNLSQNSKYGYYKQLHHFLNFLFEYNYTQMFIINRDIKPKAEIKEKIVFSDADVIRIFENLPTKKNNFILTVYLLFYTGLRSSDILTIEVEKLDLNNNLLRYYSPKRKAYREIPFHSALLPVLENAALRIKSGKILNYKNVENINRAVTRYFTTIGIGNKKYSARTFRKTFITLCRTKYDMDATVVKELVGHEHRNTRDRYYNYISFDKMKKELEKFEMPIKLRPKSFIQKLMKLFFSFLMSLGLY